MEISQYIKLPNGYKIIYLTYYGSRLYGTETINSDTDIKGIFIPSKEDVLLKKDIDSFRFDSNKDKNTKEDIDIELYSIHKYLDLLKKGETGAVDILFSSFREDTVIINEGFDIIKDNYKELITNNINAFKGYVLQQTKKYGVKGSRFGTLEKLISLSKDKEYKLVNDFYESNKEVTKLEFIQKDNKYLEVLGKQYELTSKYDGFIKNIQKSYDEYSSRSKKASEENCYDAKAISHAYRVIKEIEELLTTSFLKFPLDSREIIINIKNSDVDFKEVLEDIESQIDNLNNLVKSSNLRKEVNQKLINSIILSFY